MLCLQKLLKVGSYLEHPQISLSFSHFKDILKTSFELRISCALPVCIGI